MFSALENKFRFRKLNERNALETKCKAHAQNAHKVALVTSFVHHFEAGYRADLVQRANMNTVSRGPRVRGVDDVVECVVVEFVRGVDDVVECVVVEFVRGVDDVVVELQEAHVEPDLISC